MRAIVDREGLQDALFENVTKSLQKLFKFDPTKQRLDSVHLFSNMAHLGRIRLFVRTIHIFLTNYAGNYLCVLCWDVIWKISSP